MKISLKKYEMFLYERSRPLGKAVFFKQCPEFHEARLKNRAK
jgi:hypothetical protein